MKKPFRHQVDCHQNTCRDFTKDHQQFCACTCTPIEEPTEEKCLCGMTKNHLGGCRGEDGARRCLEEAEWKPFKKEITVTKDGVPTIMILEGAECKGTGEEEIETYLSNLDKQNKVNGLGFCIGCGMTSEGFRSLIAEKEALAREEERKRIVEIVDGLQKELEEKEGKKDLSHIGKVVYYYLHRAKTEITRP